MTFELVLTGFIGLLLILSVFWRPPRLDRYVWLMVGAYAVMGVWALRFGLLGDTGDEPEWLEIWKPTILYWTLALILFISPFLGWGFPVKSILGTYFVLSHQTWNRLNWIFTGVLTLFGAINILVSHKDPGNWEGFKYSFLINLMFLILLRFNFGWGMVVSRIIIHAYKQYKARFP